MLQRLPEGNPWVGGESCGKDVFLYVSRVYARQREWSQVVAVQ